MHVILYGTASDKRKLHKNLVTIADLPDVNIKDSPNSLSDPFIIVETFPNWKQVNYCYIEELGRYYFVVDSNELTGLRIGFNLHTDVLMSNVNEIENLQAIVNRGTSATSDYLVDSEQPLLNYRHQSIINFPSNMRFNTSLTYVLAVAGGEGST